MFYFTADTHFSSRRTLEFSKRPFFSTSEMDETLIKNWNYVVGVDDIVYHLGDFGDFSIAKYLNGKIRLIVGNYERGIEKEISQYKNIELLDFPTYNFALLTSEENREQVELVHEPSNASGKFFVLFGHVHEKCTMKRNGLNVGTDCHHYFPINEERVCFYKNAIEKYYDEEVWSEYCGKH